MSKGLEVLKTYLDKRIKDIKNYLEVNERSEDEEGFTPSEELQICYLAKRMLAVDNANPSEALKCVDKLEQVIEEITISNADLRNTLKASVSLAIIKQSLLKAQEQEKVLDVIKNKRVNVANLIDWFNNSRNTSYEGYLSDYYQEGWFIHFKDNDGVDIMYQLTQEEFDTLKRWQNNK